MIFVVRTTAGREEQVADRIAARAKKENIPIAAIMHPAEVKGYIFVEAEERDDVRRAIYKMQHARGIVGTVELKDLEHFFAPAAERIEINIGDIVEVIAGPFKGERGKVKRVNKAKEEIVIELLEAVAPIPITVRIDSVRVVKRGEEGE